MAHAWGWEMTAIGEPPRRAQRVLDPGAHEVVVEVAGCGVCHTDLGFLFDGVPTRHALPLVLGHEISGIVVEAGAHHADMVGNAVVVPAVVPCGECAACRSGRQMICARQVMPGNDRDGGFATHVVVPAAGLCRVDAARPDDAVGSVPGLTLRHLSVVADAVSTPFRAVRRSGLTRGRVAIVVGLGGVGGYAAQIAHALGAYVVGLDVDERKLARAASFGVDLALDPRSMSSRDLKRHLKTEAKAAGADPSWWTLFECSGTGAGQRTAYSLLVHGATLMVVGFTLDKTELRLSNLMAFDARAIGTWGCEPELYPELLPLVLDGRVDLLGHTELRDLETFPEAIADVHAHRAERRLVMAPHFTQRD